MKLNLHILYDFLHNLGFQGTLQNEPFLRELTYPVICTSWPESIQETVLYIVNCKTLPSNPSVPSRASILCIGKPEDKRLADICNFLYTEDTSLDLIDLINQINNEFYKYQEWIDELTTCINNQNSFSRIAKLATQVLHNPFEIWETSIYLLCFCLPTKECNTPLYQKFKKDHAHWYPGMVMKDEEFQELLTDEEYNDSFTYREPTIFSGKPHEFRTMFLNIFNGNTPVARICISEIIQPFSSKDFAMLQILGNLLSASLTSKSSYSFRQQSRYLDVLKGLIEHRLQSEHKINLFLDEQQWHSADEYLCFIVKNKMKISNPHANLTALSMRLAKTLSASCYVLCEDHLVYICNLSVMKKSREAIYNAILPFLRDSFQSASISTCFYDFKSVYYFYQQAIIAEKCGEKKNPEKWYYKFEDYQVEYLLQQYTNKLHVQTLIPPGLIQLIEYDKRKNTAYIETLETYLENACDSAATTHQLYLHRNTLAYRITRIQEITGFDLNISDHRLVLLLALRLLERT